jgi:hypothetical protein
VVKKLGVVETQGGERVMIHLSEPTTAPEGQMSEAEFNKLIVQQDARAGWDGAPFRHFSIAEMAGRLKREYKSYEFIVAKELMNDAFYWCQFFHGGDSIIAHKFIPGGLVAVYSEYQCW